MLLNNLDPEVAERPEELVVYGGSGKAARNHDALRAIVRSLLTLGEDETLLVQSGKPVGVLRTHPGAPRVLIANALLVPRWATWDEFRRLEAVGLTMFGQMTAGSWIYIGTQGILQGTYQTFAAAGEQHFGVGRSQRADDPHRRARRNGRRAAARGDDGGRGDPLRRGRSRRGSSGGSRPGTSTARRTRSTRRSRSFGDAAREAACALGRPARQRRRGRSRARRAAASTSTSSPTRPPRTIRSRATCLSGCRSRRPRSCARATPTSTSAGPASRSRATSRGCSSTSERAAMFSIMATIFAGRRMKPA